MAQREHFVIVGASLAGLRGSEALRAGGYDGRITIVGGEAMQPYNRPPLSKKILTGEQTLQDLYFPIAADLDVAWRLGQPATALDVGNRQITLRDGDKISYDKLLIATGVNPIMPPINGRELKGIHVLRDFRDAEALQRDLKKSKSIVILGAGFIGCEVAAIARRMGLQVTIVDRLSWPMNRSMDRDIATIFRQIHEEEGVRFRMECQVEAFVGEDSVSGVQLAGGDVIEADIVLVGVGSAPAVKWLEGSGLVLQNGVVCDEACFAINGEGRIAAAGDVAVWPHLGFGGEVMRMEHWTNAFEQGAAAALNLSRGSGRPYAPLPSFWSDQYEYKIQALGRPKPTDSATVVAGSLEARKFILEYADETGVTGILSVNMPARIASYRRNLEEAIRAKAMSAAAAA